MKYQKVHKDLSWLIIIREALHVESIRVVLIYFDDSPRLINPEEPIYGLLSIAAIKRVLV